MTIHRLKNLDKVYLRSPTDLPKERKSTKVHP
jgi:hypothetical protein